MAKRYNIMKKYSINMDLSDWKTMIRIAECKGINTSECVRRAIEAWIIKDLNKTSKNLDEILNGIKGEDYDTWRT